MKIVVTGAAGFIGSHLVDRLLREGHQVVGIDALLREDWRHVQFANLANALQDANFIWIRKNMLEVELEPIAADADIVFHHAAIAGVRQSWGSEFGQYMDANIRATHRLLEACKHGQLRKFVYASSSSVYGGSEGAVSEDAPLQPVSPYGMSKLAGEHLVRMYYLTYGVPATSLRYFTVYGPRQRPDMAFHKFFKAVLEGRSLPVYGDGSQTRDFTYVADVVEANLQVMKLQKHGNVFNIGGIERASVLDILQLMQELTDRDVRIEYLPKQAGDPDHTRADLSAAREKLGYIPQIGLRAGLAEEWNYIRQLYA
jgi:nucleoside-diphosphate-sugar epimerase